MVCTFWYAIPTSLFIFNDFSFLYIYIYIYILAFPATSVQDTSVALNTGSSKGVGPKLSSEFNQRKVLVHKQNPLLVSIRQLSLL